MPTLFDRLQHAWNAFRGRDRPIQVPQGSVSFSRPDRVRMRLGNERTIIGAIYNRIAVDVATHKIEHVILDDNGRYLRTVNDKLNTCLTLEANIDQTSRAFFQDVVLSLFDEGCIAIVPIDTNVDPRTSTTYDVSSMRTAKIVQWYPQHVMVEAYNDRSGKRERLIFPKRSVAIIENPFYSVMNEPNSILKRLIRKLTIMDQIDEQTGSGKLDLIIQLPYVIKSDARKAQAETRRKDIEMQLTSSKYGIAYTDGTEKITQLNRPLENNLMGQIEYLINTLYSQLGVTPEILNGTADEKTMLNYNSRTVEPILSAITDELKRKMLTKTARSQHHSIVFSYDPFKLIPISNIADIADRFTRNEILSPNEVRGLIGMKPNPSPMSDELRNRNINQNGMMMHPQENPYGMGAPEETEENDPQSGLYGYDDQMQAYGR